MSDDITHIGYSYDDGPQRKGRTFQQNPDGSWTPATPIGWLEEHNWLQRLVLAIRGQGHCGKRGWRTGVGY